MSLSKFDLDAVVLGAAAMDMLAWVNHLPARDGIELARKVEMRPGGAGANVAVATSRLGLKVGFISQIGSDEHGRILLDEFSREKVDTAACLIVQNQPTAICFIAIDTSGDRSMVAMGGAGPIERREELDRDYLSKARLFYLTDVGPNILQFTAEIARVQKSLLIYSPGGIMASKGLDAFVKILPDVDLLLLSQNESNSLLPGIIPQLAVRDFFEKGARNVVITLGAGGALLHNSEGTNFIPSFPVDSVVDTTGAGDALAGGLIAGLLWGDSIRNSIRFGCAAASIKITRPGARAGLPTHEQLDLFLSSHPLE